DGAIDLFTDAFFVAAGGTIDAGAGTVTLAPATLTDTIEICGGAGCVGGFDAQYDLADLAITAGSFTIGRGTHTGDVTLNALTVAFPLAVVNSGVGAVTVAGA